MYIGTVWFNCTHVCVILLNNKQAEKLRGRGFYEVYEPSFWQVGFFYTSPKSTNWIKIRSIQSERRPISGIDSSRKSGNETEERMFQFKGENVAIRRSNPEIDANNYRPASVLTVLWWLARNGRGPFAAFLDSYSGPTIEKHAERVPERRVSTTRKLPLKPFFFFARIFDESFQEWRTLFIGDFSELSKNFVALKFFFFYTKMLGLLLIIYI